MELPLGSAPTLFRNNRGLSQGLSSSVLKCELCLATLLFRLMLSVPNLEAVAYVDDLNLMSCTKEDIVRTLQVVSDCAQHFCLSLSLLKTCIWCSSESDAVELAKQFGCGSTDSISALGGEWPVMKKPVETCTYEKEMTRIDKCISRLERLGGLPVHPIEKFGLAATGCLSPLAYLNARTMAPLREVRSLLKQALGLRWAAPEILPVGLSSSVIDPDLHLASHWALSLGQSPCMRHDTRHDRCSDED